MIDRIMIGIMIGEIMISKIINDSIPKLDIKQLFKKGVLNKKIHHEDSCKIAKTALLLPISRLYELPQFNIEDSTMNEELLKAYFEVAIKLVTEFDLGDDNLFKYHASNFLAFSVQNRNELIGYLKREQQNPTENNARYRLGFRSISFIMENNLDKIDTFYISYINSKLQPFFSSFKHTELLINGLKPE
jgi:hypothetical protein